MPRSLWTGTVSFGLVNIPVRLVTAVRDKRIHFNLLNEDGTCRLRRKLYCPETGEEYDFNQTARGYEIAPDQYVIIRDEELEQLQPEAGRTIDINEFVELASIDPVYFDRTYYLLPDEGGAKPYQLLIEALQQTRRVGIARFVMRQRQHLAALRVMDEQVLVLHTMHYHDEVTAAEDLGGDLSAEVDVSDREREVAKQLIDALGEAFDPTKYEDEYRHKVEQLIEAKSEGEGVSEVLGEAQSPPPPTYNLMEALKASVEGTKQKKSGKAGKSGKTSRKKTSKKTSKKRKSA